MHGSDQVGVKPLCARCYGSCQMTAAALELVVCGSAQVLQCLLWSCCLQPRLVIVMRSVMCQQHPLCVNNIGQFPLHSAEQTQPQLP
jgi:hypothetical protein